MKDNRFNSFIECSLNGKTSQSILGEESEKNFPNPSYRDNVYGESMVNDNLKQPLIDRNNIIV
jgi:hypothetical protein